MNAIVGSHDLLLVVLDTLRFDVAERARREGRTPAPARCKRSHEDGARRAFGASPYHVPWIHT
jgi:hypothetical protein